MRECECGKQYIDSFRYCEECGRELQRQEITARDIYQTKPSVKNILGKGGKLSKVLN